MQKFEEDDQGSRQGVGGAGKGVAFARVPRQSSRSEGYIPKRINETCSTVPERYLSPKLSGIIANLSSAGLIIFVATSMVTQLCVVYFAYKTSRRENLISICNEYL